MRNEVMLKCKNKTKKSVKKLLLYLTTFFVVLYLYHVFVKKKRGAWISEHITVNGRRNGQNISVKFGMSTREDFGVVGVDKVIQNEEIQANQTLTKPYKGEANVNQNNSSGCGASWYTDWEKITRIEPLIKLDNKRYVTAILINGPNNQLIGLRDTMYLAIRLNRTLILPNFFKHKTDSSVKKYSATAVPPSQRVNVASVATLMSFVPHSELEKICGESFDDFYFTTYKASLSSLDDSPLPVKEEERLYHSYPKDMRQSFNMRTIDSGKSLTSLYTSPGKCALYAFPFNSVGVKQTAETLNKTAMLYFDGISPKIEEIDPDTLSDKELYSLTVHSTRKPRFIEEIVDEFLNANGMRDQPYLSAHWRYDHMDFQNRCRHKERLRSRGKEFMIEMCDKIDRIEPRDVARAIVQAIRRLEKKTPEKILAVYFAAPLTMKDFIVDIKSALSLGHSLEKVKVLTQENLKAFLDKYSSCEKLNENFEDVFSQLEMEVCSRSVAFLRSPSSSWSQVISTMRTLKPERDYDGNLFHIAWEVASKRIGK